MDGPAVEIVVPIYNATGYVKRCVASVLACATGSWRLVLCDDASTDPELVRYLEEVSGDDRVHLLRNPSNRGFVVTANRGMREAAGRDVLLLNSDTEVFPGFLERLRDAAHAHADTGMVTPLSNNATICSVPRWLEDNPIPAGFSAAGFAELIAACSRKERPELVTPVGFCMYIRAEVLAKIGFFDEETFGRGFGEENDFGERAKRAGFRIRLADDVFVWHKGSASFGGEVSELKRRNGATLAARHPRYLPAVEAFIRDRPLRALHETIDFAVARGPAWRRPAVLMILPWPPFGERGGTELHALDLVRALRLPRTLIAYPRGAALEVAEIRDGRLEAAQFFRFPLDAPVEQVCVDRPDVTRRLLQLVEWFGVGGVHLQHLLFWPITIGAALADAGIPYVITCHDFYAVCPSWNLFDHARRAPCECRPGGAGCVDAVPRLGVGPPAPTGPRDGAALRRAHRQAFLELLRRAGRVVFPSRAARDLAGAHLDLGRFRTEVIEHGFDAVPVRAPQHAGSGRLRVAILGKSLLPAKGAALYDELIAGSQDLPVEWHFWGCDGKPSERVFFHGGYERAQIVAGLQQAGMELYLALPLGAETYSYTLTEALCAGLPAVVLDSGVVAERVRELGAGVVVASVAEARAAIEGLCNDRARLASLAAVARTFRPPSTEENARRWLDCYRENGLWSDDAGPVRGDAIQELFRHRVAREGAADGGRVVASRRWSWLPSSVRRLAKRVLGYNSPSAASRR